VNAFVIEAPHRPGELARIAEAIAAKGINITGLAATTIADKGAVAVLTNDEAGTRKALEDAGLRFTEHELVVATLDDRPGSLADTARRLGNAGVNIEFLMGTGVREGKVTVAIGTDDAQRARVALGELVAAGG
jgi:hypothetical protein